MSAPAPTGAWGPDLLGPGFEARTLELLPDEEDDGAVATLVRHVPASDPGALPSTPTTPTRKAPSNRTHPTHHTFTTRRT